MKQIRILEHCSLARGRSSLPSLHIPRRINIYLIKQVLLSLFVLIMREELLSMSVPCGLRIFAGAYSVLTASVFSPADMASFTMCIRTYNKRSGEEEEGKHLMTRARKKEGRNRKPPSSRTIALLPPNWREGKEGKGREKEEIKVGSPSPPPPPPLFFRHP